MPLIMPDKSSHRLDGDTIEASSVVVQDVVARVEEIVAKGGLSQRIVSRGRDHAALVETIKCRKSGLSACRKGKKQKSLPSPDTIGRG
jgi:hypothetical protein